MTHLFIWLLGVLKPEDLREWKRTEADKSVLAPIDSEFNISGDFCQICTSRGTKRGLSSCRFPQRILIVDLNFRASAVVEERGNRQTISKQKIPYRCFQTAPRKPQPSCPQCIISPEKAGLVFWKLWPSLKKKKKKAHFYIYWVMRSWSDSSNHWIKPNWKCLLSFQPWNILIFFSLFPGQVCSQKSEHKLALGKWTLDSEAHSERERSFLSWAVLFSQVR